MPQSKSYINLVRRVKLIEKHLLPKTRITGNYTKRELDKIRGYRLLVHAELEAYFEDRAKARVIEAVSEWKKRKTPSNILLALMAFNEAKYTAISTSRIQQTEVSKPV